MFADTLWKNLFMILMTILSLSFAAHGWAGPEVEKTDDLQATGQLAHNQGVLVLLVFSAHHCSYCKTLEAEVLKPMLLNAEYRSKILIRKVMVDDEGTVRNFAGKEMEIGSLMAQHEIRVTPTLLFVDPQGKELTQRMIGINTVDFYAGQVDEAIDQSLKKLGKPSPTQSYLQF